MVGVRRLAAIDMYGAHGSGKRRRIITAEFVLGASAMAGFGIWLLARAVSPMGVAVGVWMTGAGLNYVPLAVHAMSMLRRPGALETELAGVDIPTEARRHGLLQAWIAVPGSLVVFDLLQRRRTAAR